MLVTRCELLDAMTIGALNAYKGTTFPESPYLFVEFGGTEAGVAGDLAAAREIAEDEGASAFESESDPTARARMWDARHNALHASLALQPGSRAMTTDVAVPLSELAPAMAHARDALDASGLRGGIVGHAGDGNFHVAFLLDPDDDESIARRRGAEHDARRGRARTRRHLHRRARHRLREARATSSSSTATCCRSCAASSSCSTRTGS